MLKEAILIHKKLKKTHRVFFWLGDAYILKYVTNLKSLV